MGLAVAVSRRPLLSSMYEYMGRREYMYVCMYVRMRVYMCMVVS